MGQCQTVTCDVFHLIRGTPSEEPGELPVIECLAHRDGGAFIARYGVNGNISIHERQGVYRQLLEHGVQHHVVDDGDDLSVQVCGCIGTQLRGPSEEPLTFRNGHGQTNGHIITCHVLGSRSAFALVGQDDDPAPGHMEFHVPIHCDGVPCGMHHIILSLDRPSEEHVSLTCDGSIHDLKGVTRGHGDGIDDIRIDVGHGGCGRDVPNCMEHRIGLGSDR